MGIPVKAGIKRGQQGMLLAFPTAPSGGVLKADGVPAGSHAGTPTVQQPRAANSGNAMRRRAGITTTTGPPRLRLRGTPMSTSTMATSTTTMTPTITTLPFRCCEALFRGATFSGSTVPDHPAPWKPHGADDEMMVACVRREKESLQGAELPLIYVFP